ncbi:hypothetical protein ACN47E_001552 [Coniothyrium glycines]
MAHHSAYSSPDEESCTSVTDYSHDSIIAQIEENVAENTVSVVGMGCRWPGGVETPSQLWDLLAQGRSCYQDFDESKFNISAFHHPNPQRPGSTPARGAYQLQEDPKLFDHAFFGITPKEVLTLDPQHRKLLEVVYEAFESAGEPWEKVSGSRTGVFVGNFTTDNNFMSMRDMDNILPYTATGGSTSILSNRINYVFNLRGPSLTLDTACSSSLYALHLAVNAIKNGDCDSAVVGAGNLILSPDLHLSLSKLGALSPTATCHVFDAAADGYARGEGFAAFYLKRTADAITGAYPIRSVIRGTAVNSNGRTAGITHPSVEGQVEVIRRAYAAAGLDPSKTGYFEAHGTGTQVGDPTEIQAIGEVFSAFSHECELRIGSIKSNIGHTEAASGMAGMMKAILAMENDSIPPTVGISQLNPRIDFNQARVRPVETLEKWPVNRLRRASVNSFGYGGANGHCILDHVSVALPTFAKQNLISFMKLNNTLDVGARCDHLIVLPFSGKDEIALTRNVEDISDVVREHDIADIAYTLSARRSRFRHRTYRLVDTGNHDVRLNATAAPSYEVLSKGTPSRIGLVFTGQGAQWEGMGKELLKYHAFRKSILDQDTALACLSNKASWSIHEVIQGKLTETLREPLVSQTVCTALQIALVDLMHSWGVRWNATVGHSSGEIAATYAAGLITAAEAIVIAFCRGLAVSSNKRSGLMLAVGLGVDEIASYLTGLHHNVKIAAINSPLSVTLSGDTANIMDIHEALMAKNIFTKLLHTGHNAYHSHHMTSVGDAYTSVLDKAMDELSKEQGSSKRYSQRKTCWFSSATAGKCDDKDILSSTYWRENLQAPVKFSEAVQNMVQSTTLELIIEVGPHSALRAPLRQVLSHVAMDLPYIPTLCRREDGVRNMLDLAGILFCLDAAIDLHAVNSAHTHGQIDKLRQAPLATVCIDLPKIRYRYGPVLYHESRLSKENRLRECPKHDILGSKQVGVSRLRPSWRNILRVKDVPWLAHHKLGSQTVFPASGYICMAMEAADQFFQPKPGSQRAIGFTIRNLALKSAFLIPDTTSGAEVILDLDASQSTKRAGAATWYTFHISSFRSDTSTWTEHCSGIIKPITQRVTQEVRSIDIDSRQVSAAKWYQKLAHVGLEYGESFRGLSDIKSDPLLNVAKARVALETTSLLFDGPESRYMLHPTSLDMCAQLALIAAHGGQVEQASTAFVPSFIGEISIWASDTKDTSAVATARGWRSGLRGAHVQAQLLQASGAVVLDMLDVRCIAYAGIEKADETKNKAHNLLTPYMRLVWRPDIQKLSSDQAASLFPPTETTGGMENTFADIHQLGYLMVREISERYVSRLEDNHMPIHLRKFLAWAQRMAAASIDQALDSHEQRSTERMHLIENLCAKLHHVVEIPLAKRILDSLGDILSGTKSSLELVRQDDSHTRMYESGLGVTAAYIQLERLLDLLAHSNPGMKILEIGAGTGGATRVALNTLLGESSHLHRFTAYTFTDVSSGYFPDARKEFMNCHSLDFAVLDIELPPIEQGFRAEYDLIIASCSIHVTKDVQLTLQHARSLLKPGGKLLILECTQPMLAHGIVLGTLPDYWMGTEDCQLDSPFLPSEQWRLMLREAGFPRVDVELDDYAPPYTMISTFLCSTEPLQRRDLKGPAPKSTGITTVCVVSSNEASASLFVDTLNTGDLSTSSFSCAPIPTDDIAFLSLKDILVKSCSVVWINVKNNDVESYPYAGAATGLLRVVAGENPSVKYASIDVSLDDLYNSAIVQQILAVQESMDIGGDIYTNTEFRVVTGILHNSRLIPDEEMNNYRMHLGAPQTSLVRIGDQRPLAANFAKPGILSSIYFEEDETFWQPLEDNQLEIRTIAVGLNWKDLAVSAGRLDLTNFSSEFSGIVTQVGKGVTSFRIGDRVYGISKGKFGNFMRCHASLVQHMYRNDFVEMAVTPVVYMTALYAFKHLARLQAGEKVLIQSASGGLGIAALNLARSMGAEIWVTVGNEEKQRFIEDTYNIPVSRIFSSRNSPDITSVRKTTDGTGFDVILSTASGDAFNEWLRCLAPTGHFIDVGRTEVQDHATLALEAFRSNATFSSFDLGVLIEKKPELCAKLLAEVHNIHCRDIVRHFAPIESCNISHLATALLQFSKGTHIGKVAITYEDPASLINVRSSRSILTRFDSAAQYVLVGGLGGLGRSIMSWMAKRGASQFAVLSRTPRHNASDVFCTYMESQGCNIEHIPCDVTQACDVEAAIARVADRGLIKGVIHSAVLLQDKLFESLSPKEWRKGLAVKIDGTINLHEATLRHPLDFFIMLSSNVAQVALPTQATYCASNNFQNEFARWRQQQGLPATAVELGLVDETGDLGQHPVYHKATMRNGLYHTSEHELLQRFEDIFASFDRQSAASWAHLDAYAEAHLVTSLDPAILLEAERLQSISASSIMSSKPRWQSDPRFCYIMRMMSNIEESLLGDSKQSGHPDAVEDISATLAEIDACIQGRDLEKATRKVVKTIVDRVADMLFISSDDIDQKKGIAAYGMDSLIAAELRNWFAGTYRCTIAFLRLLDAATSIDELARIVIDSRSKELQAY